LTPFSVGSGWAFGACRCVVDEVIVLNTPSFLDRALAVRRVRIRLGVL